jgi:hypothetical protein
MSVKQSGCIICGCGNAVEQKEAWCRRAVPIVDVGLINPEEFIYPLDTKENIKEYQQNNLHPSLIGAAKILEELHIQFNILDSNSDFHPYKVIILPDYVVIQENNEACKRFVALTFSSLRKCQTYS